MWVEFRIEQNLASQWLLKQKDIPCICRIGREFEIDFVEPLPAAHGKVGDWDLQEICNRALPSVGGTYTHYSNARITVSTAANDRYDILDFAIFNSTVGWRQILLDREYTIID